MMPIELEPHLNAVALSGGVPEEEEWNAGEEASKETIEESALAQVVGIPVD